MTVTTDSLITFASNLRWTWDHATRNLLSTVPGARPGLHPLVAIRAAPAREFDPWLAANGGGVDTLNGELEALVSSVDPPDVACFPPEFGIAAEVPQYSGGLGVLAGDHLKAASDLSLPLAGIGILYRGDFFRQEILADQQQERYETIDPGEIGAEDTGRMVSVPISGSDVSVRVWKQMVGATVLLLLDTDHPDNSESDRKITDRLYSGDRRHRLSSQRRSRLLSPARASGRTRRSRLFPGRGRRVGACLLVVHHSHTGAGRYRHLHT